MNQLSGKFVNLVLSIGDGRGMDFVRHPLHVAANYSGRILESDRIVAQDQATFNTELIWEVDKKDLRKMRSSNQPLRVECLSTDPQNRRDRIGFVLLSIRAAQIITIKDVRSTIFFKWHKLIGCQTDKKKHHPELYLALSIRDHSLNDHEENLPKNMPLISEEEQIMANEETEFTSNFPLKYLEDGYIQIGEDDEYESFSLNLLVKEGRNLDTLLPEALVFRQNHEKYHMNFKIFGVMIKTKPFYKNLHDTFSLNEKVVVRILSNQDTLFEFFSSQTITISLINGHELLGTAEVLLKQISFDEQNLRCFFKLPHPNDIIPFGGDEQSPFLEINAWLKKSTDARFKLNLNLDKSPAKVIRSNLEDQLSSPNAFGDHVGSYVLDKLHKVDVKAKSECSLVNGDCDNVAITKSADTVIRNIPLSPRQVGKCNVMGTYVRYMLEVTLQKLVWKMAPKDRIVIFKFLHPRASNYITIVTQVSNVVGETTDLKNIGVKISYVSTIEQMENLLNAWPPKLVLTDEKERLLSEEFEFDVSKFFGDRHKNYEYAVDLKAVRTLQPLARLQVTLNLEEVDVGDPEYASGDFTLKPPIVDEILTVKELSDIEKWKKEQKALFDSELDQFKLVEGQKLETLWQDKRADMELKLNAQIKKCQKLKEQLQLKVSGIKTEKYLTRRRNHANIFEEIYKDNWDKYYKSDIREVIELLSKTQRDNEYLRKLVEDQREKLDALEKTTLTKEQTTSLLQELKGLEQGFEEAQQAKKYFKEQWHKACEEIHQMKLEEYKEMQVSLKISREELSELSLNDSNNCFEEEDFWKNQDDLVMDKMEKY